MSTAGVNDSTCASWTVSSGPNTFARRAGQVRRATIGTNCAAGRFLACLQTNSN
jgi:hypothetical protein